MMQTQPTVDNRPGRIRSEPITEQYVTLDDGRRPYEVTVVTTHGFRYVLIYGTSRHDAELRANALTGHMVAGMRVLDPRGRRRVG